MTYDMAPAPRDPELTSTTEYLGVISGEAGRRTVFLSRLLNGDGGEVYSMVSLTPAVPSLLEQTIADDSDAWETLEDGRVRLKGADEEVGELREG